MQSQMHEASARRHSTSSPSPGTTSEAMAEATVAATILTANQFKLLYLINLYAVASNSTRQNERWIRHVPLLVLMFEGILCDAFDFDYAPASMRLSFKGKTLRRWINFSREGKAAIDDLWALRLINGLKLSSDDFQPITAYQVSIKGQLVLRFMPRYFQDTVDAFLYPPAPLERRLLVVRYDGQHFILRSGGYSKPSSITESDDVSYVSSPFLPRCLRSRSGGYYKVQERSNADRAQECALGATSITKKTSEAVTLGDVYALIGEWVPFGTNQIVALNERMGVLDRCQGGILTSCVDSNPTDTQFRVPVGQTQVRVLDYDFVRFTNFEAESHFPETPGIVQIENFGMHLNSDGSLIYGIKVEAIMDRLGDDVAIDHLSRLLVDVHQDSSMLVNDLLSRYQLSLLEMLYLGDSFQRNKYNCILSKQIRPKLPAQAYVNDPRYANELAQVLGDIHGSHDLTPDDVLVVGKAGCLFSGPNVFRYEHVFTSYVGLVCRDIFIKNFFARTFVLDATLKEIRQLIHKVHREPATVLQVREKLSAVSKDTILLAETLEYLLDSLENVDLSPSGHFSDDLEESGEDSADGVRRRTFIGSHESDVDARLFQVLALPQLKAQTIMRCHDSIKLMENTMLQLEQLQMIAESTATNQLETACSRVNLNTRALMTAVAQQASMTVTLHALQYFVGGIFMFDVIDRLTGGTWNGHIPEWAMTSLIDPVLHHPFLWWAINLLVFAAFVAALKVLSDWFVRCSLGWCEASYEVNRRISLAKLDTYLGSRGVQSSVTLRKVATGRAKKATRFRLLKWQETDAALWGGVLPQIELSFDDRHGFLLFVSLRFDGKRSPRVLEEECYHKFVEIFTRAEILLEDPLP
ncbi:Lysine-specific demethylase 4B [Phytophthora pseudosyringae]|uniref:Lysine-specific demethylase 4B n=1 Tax=Phytophthora pseudosyringae TaxID=221518 RepID=A0A8T1VGA9_9STRA|nr:Lysine-specific demethylase 4B [Phytophthora pseudosyringae]